VAGGRTGGSGCVRGRPGVDACVRAGGEEFCGGGLGQGAKERQEQVGDRRRHLGIDCARGERRPNA
jgi:hypothetical protein